jgi:hypothetical protein
LITKHSRVAKLKKHSFIFVFKSSEAVEHR